MTTLENCVSLYFVLVEHLVRRGARLDEMDAKRPLNHHAQMFYDATDREYDRLFDMKCYLVDFIKSWDARDEHEVQLKMQVEIPEFATGDEEAGDFLARAAFSDHRF